LQLKQQLREVEGKKDGEIGILRARLHSVRLRDCSHDHDLFQTSEDVGALKQQLFDKTQREEESRKEVDRLAEQIAFKEHELRYFVLVVMQERGAQRYVSLVRLQRSCNNRSSNKSSNLVQLMLR
jgi:hypothetical protein